MGSETENSPTNPSASSTPNPSHLAGTYPNLAYPNNYNNDNITSGGETDKDSFTPPEGSSMIEQVTYQARLKVKLEEACKDIHVEVALILKCVRYHSS
jgi:hypothetical protein